MAYPEGADAAWIDRAQVFFLACSAILTSDMFRMGLPLRGVVHEGNFIIEDMCFAGNGIVDAYRLCESLNISGTVCSPHLYKKLLAQKNVSTISNDSEILFSYLTPMKDGSEVRMLHLNWTHFSTGNNEKSIIEKDVENYILKSFWAHQKDCSSAVDQKVRNTVKIVRKMIQNAQAAQLNKISVIKQQ